ncbi:hypothetical protein V8C35DRAFT_292686 [Trichoderma chlorosporum]
MNMNISYNLTIPISISAQNARFNLRAPVSEVDVTNLFLDWVRPGINLTDSLLTGVRFHLPFNNYNYSYVSQAVQHGYSNFTWDRHGIAAFNFLSSSLQGRELDKHH